MPGHRCVDGGRGGKWQSFSLREIWNLLVEICAVDQHIMGSYW